jgi:outer membrane lipoprotein-sorting protein
MMRIPIWLLLTTINAAAAYGQPLTATQIVQQSLDLAQGSSNSATLTMKIVREGWTRELGIKSWSLGTDYALILITDPPRDKGTVFLKRGSELWNWQPKIERSIKMPPSMMLQSWMGSDFTNDDLVKQSSIVDDYTHRLLKEEAIEGRPCYMIELLPKEDAAVVWGKLVVWITKAGFMTLKNEFYDEDNVLVNTMTGSNIRRMDNREIPTQLEVVPAEEPGKKTIVIYEALDFDIEIDESFFSIQNMKEIN